LQQVIAEAGGPRQPWHDWHCKIEGPASYDILTNFEQCWRKATRLHDDELVNIDKSGWILGPSNQAPLEGDPAVYVTDDYDEESWHVQVFRSIDGGSVKGFPKTMEEVQTQHLVWGKSIAIDVSIQMAYVKAIRMAQHFIYIENQYFLGSSYNWPDYDVAGNVPLYKQFLSCCFPFVSHFYRLVVHCNGFLGCYWIIGCKVLTSQSSK
jgi:phospholipase D1/2